MKIKMMSKSISQIQSPYKLNALLFLVCSSLSLTACQTAPTSPVIQRENSTFETTGIGNTKIKAQENALTSANKTCGRKQAIVLDDDLKYNGVFDERTGRLIDQVGSIAGVVLGTDKPEMSRDDDYEYTIKFRCQ